MTRTIFIALPLLLLAGCNSQPEGNSTTKLDAVEVQPGSVSDSMIILDDVAADGTAIDNSIPDDGTKKDAAKPAATDEADANETPDDPEAVEAPVAQKSVTTDSAAKRTN